MTTTKKKKKSTKSSNKVSSKKTTTANKPARKQAPLLVVEKISPLKIVNDKKEVVYEYVAQPVPVNEKPVSDIDYFTAPEDEDRIQKIIDEVDELIKPEITETSFDSYQSEEEEEILNTVEEIVNQPSIEPIVTESDEISEQVEEVITQPEEEIQVEQNQQNEQIEQTDKIEEPESIETANPVKRFLLTVLASIKAFALSIATSCKTIWSKFTTFCSQRVELIKEKQQARREAAKAKKAEREASGEPNFFEKIKIIAVLSVKKIKRSLNRTGKKIKDYFASIKEKQQLKAQQRQAEKELRKQDREQEELLKQQAKESELSNLTATGMIKPIKVVDQTGTIVLDRKALAAAEKKNWFANTGKKIKAFFSDINNKLFKDKYLDEGEEKKQAVSEELLVDEPLTDEEKKSLNRQIKSRKFANSVMGVLVFFVLLGALSGFSTVGVILSKTDVILDTKDIRNQDSTLIFDDQGERVAIVGKESRISYSYSSFPQVVIDAFVSIEDSRFFEHPVFDVPRFAKAFLENIKSLSFAQGGSTLTMQVIKNTYFAVDTIAPKGIDRKVQEIYYALKINKIVSKEKIFELYVNKVNYGETARGIQVASQYYFDKNCTELSLVEAAMLAGLVKAPNGTNPYYYLQECYERTGEVLYQMKNHGYITDEEYKFAKNVKLENLLIGKKEVAYGSGVTVDNQAYIDIVLNELDEVYNINPYETPVRVYTNLNQHVQAYCDEVSRGNVIPFEDPYVNIALSVIQNRTGKLIAVCGGRDYDGQMMFNYAYDGRINPGSTSKAIFTYPIAFENVALATNHYIFDEPIYWPYTRLQVREDHEYAGDVSTQRAFTTSYNVVAIKLYQWVKSEIGEEKMKDYLTTIGLDSGVVQWMNDQYAIGMQNFRISPVQLCAAQSMIMSYGVYTKPWTIEHIEYIDNSADPIYAEPVRRQALSPGAAWLTSYLEMVSVNGNGNADDWAVNGRLRTIKHSDYLVYGKTGTSLYDPSIREQWNMPSNATKDWLMIGGSADYSFSFWMGYDTSRHIDSNSYIGSRVKGGRHDGKFVNGLLDAVTEAFGLPKNSMEMPDDVITISHVKGLYPYVKPSALNAPSTTSYILKKNVTDATYRSTVSGITRPDLVELESMSGSYNTDSEKLTVTFTPYPVAGATTSGHYVSIVFGGRRYTLYKKFNPYSITGTVVYQVKIKNLSTGQETVQSSADNVIVITIPRGESDVNYVVTGYYTYSKGGDVSNSKTYNFTVVHKDPEPDPPVDPDPPGGQDGGGGV